MFSMLNVADGRHTGWQALNLCICMKVSGTVKRHQGDYNQQSSDYRKPCRTIIWFLPGKTIKEENKGDPKRRFTKLEENATKIYEAYLVQNSLVESMQFFHNLFFFFH